VISNQLQLAVLNVRDLGNCRDWRCKRSVWHNTDRWQLYKHCEGRDVGTQCVRQYCQILAVSTDCQLCSSHCCFSRCMCHQGQHLKFVITVLCWY